MKQAKRQLGWGERLASKMQHHARILTDRVEHDGVAELGHDLAHDPDCFGLQALQVRGWRAGPGWACSSDGHWDIHLRLRTLLLSEKCSYRRKAEELSTGWVGEPVTGDWGKPCAMIFGVLFGDPGAPQFSIASARLALRCSCSESTAVALLKVETSLISASPNGRVIYTLYHLMSSIS